MPNDVGINKLLTEDQLNTLCAMPNEEWSNQEASQVILTVFCDESLGGKGLFKETVGYFIKQINQHGNYQQTIDEITPEAESWTQKVFEDFHKFVLIKKKWDPTKHHDFVIWVRYRRKFYWKQRGEALLVEAYKDSGGKRNKIYANVVHLPDKKDEEDDQNYSPLENIAVSKSPSPEEDLTANEEKQLILSIYKIVKDFIASLPPRQKKAIVLVDWDLVSQETAARYCNCRPEALRKRLHDARKKVNKFLESQQFDYSHIQEAWKEFIRDQQRGA